MQYRSFILFPLLLTGLAQEQAFSQVPDQPVKKAVISSELPGQFNNAEIHINSVKKYPSFPGGKEAWHDFLRKNINIKVPFSNKALPGNYKVLIRFIVTREGKLLDIGADTNCGYGMESEVIRCISMSPDWLPAETDKGEKVRFTFRQAVTFIVKPGNIDIRFY